MLKMYRNTQIHVQTLNGTFHKDSDVFSNAWGVFTCILSDDIYVFHPFFPPYELEKHIFLVFHQHRKRLEPSRFS